MDPTKAIPLHFTLEFLGVAAFGGVLGWALQERRRGYAAILAVMVVAQTLHVGQFFSSGSGARALLWIIAAGAVVMLVSTLRLSEQPLWAAGWALAAAGIVPLAITGSHTTATRLSGGVFALHGVAAVGSCLLGAWSWRRALTSVRLRVAGAFVIVLFVVVAVSGGNVARVVAGNLQNEELSRLGLQVRAEQSSLTSGYETIARSSGIISPNFAPALGPGGAVAADVLADNLRTRIFTDLGFIALFNAQRQQIGGSGIQSDEAQAIAGSDVLAAPLGGTSRQAFLLLHQELVVVAAAPVYRAGAPQSPATVGGAVVLGRRYDAGEMAATEKRTGVGAAIMRPDGALVVAGAHPEPATLPAEAVRTLGSGQLWSGTLPIGKTHVFVAAAPVLLPDNTVPAVVLLSTPDTALAKTTTGVQRALFGAVLAATLIAILIALWFGSRLARPIVELTEVARRVEEGDLEATLAVHTQDEVGLLASAFESMTTSLRSTIAAESETRQQMETIVQGMGEALVAMDADFNILSFNPVAEEITGVKASEAIGQKCHEIYGAKTAGPDGKPICDYLCPLRYGGGRDGGVGIRRGGQTLALAVTCSTLTDADGHVIGGVDLMRDVTSEIQAERMKSNFLSNISHELRTPLTPIRGFADVLRRKEVPREKAVGYLNEIVGATEQLERIVAILVDVAAMEAGRLRASPNPTDAEALLRETAQRWRARSTKHAIRATAERSLPEIAADRILIGRAIDELVDNAVKFSPKGGAVTIRARRVQRGVEFSVADRGIGIPRENIDSLFEEFVQADASQTRQYGGLGLGLAFVKRVLDAHGSRLEVQSTPGRGSVFSFVLPSAASARARAAKRPGKPAGKPARKLRTAKKVT